MITVIIYQVTINGRIQGTQQLSERSLLLYILLDHPIRILDLKEYINSSECFQLLNLLNAANVSDVNMYLMDDFILLSSNKQDR